MLRFQDSPENSDVVRRVLDVGQQLTLFLDVLLREWSIDVDAVIVGSQWEATDFYLVCISGAIEK